jgi:hypothetical protein
MAFNKPGPKYRVTKMVEVRKLHPKSLVPLSEPPLQLPFTAILEGLTVDRDVYRFYYLGQPYQCLQKVLKSAIEKIDTPSAGCRSEETDAPDEVVVAAEAQPAAFGAATLDLPPPAAGAFVWQQINTNHGTLQRAKVPGGWLVKLQSSAICYYPDANHKWDGSSLD